MGLGDNIVVNDFMFCIDNGREFCHSCFCDHRLCNNIRMEFDEEMIEKIEDMVDDIDVRTFLGLVASLI